MHRLLLTLLIICLALPAVAVEACAPPVQPVHDMASDDMAAHRHHVPAAPAEEDRGPDAAAQHGCIGCVPPLAVPAIPAAAPFLAGPFAREPRALDLIPLPGPTPPPPRPTA